MMIVVCGGRDFNDAEMLGKVLRDLHLRSAAGISMVIQGGASGADDLAKQWAMKAGINCATVHAAWDKYGPAAGPKRNRAMLMFDPDMIVAFPGGKGTADMVKQANTAGITVLKAAP